MLTVMAGCGDDEKKADNDDENITQNVDDDDDVIVSMDAIIDRSTCGAECLSLVLRLVNILDDAYPEIAKARWA